MLCSLSTLSETDLKAINDLENSLQKPLLAFSCHNVDPAMVSGEELEKIQALEQKLGMSLVAVE
ncbi:MAG: hypothetical protein ACQERN_13020 [Thermodesulfobacteriota bacterium]